MPKLLVIAGGTAVGKSTLAAGIQAALSDRVSVLPLDAYYLDGAKLTIKDRRARNYDHPDIIDTQMLVRDLTEIISGRSITRPVYDLQKEERSGLLCPVDPADWVVLEGHLALTLPQATEMSDLSVFLSLDSRARLDRRLQRDIWERGRTRSEILNQWSTTVLPMHDQFIEPSLRFADAVLDATRPPQDLVEAVIALMRNRELAA